MVELALSVGKPVFPCGPTKQPMTLHGFKDASSDPARIKQMFSAASKMIGMPTGEITGVVVIDIDIKENRQGGAWLDANSHRMPQTRTIRTGSGGLHLYFNWPGKKVKNQNDKIAPGVDIRGDGGYVIVSPSPGYRVADDAPIADLPDWIMPALCPPEPAPAPAPQALTAPARSARTAGGGGTPYGLAALQDECDAIRRAPFGNQEHTLNSAGLKIGALVAGGEIDEGAALADLLSAARSMPSQPGRSPWATSQLEHKARRAFSDGKRSPRAAPDMTAVAVAEFHPAAALIAKAEAAVAKRAAAPLPLPKGIMDCGGVLQMLVEECVRTAIRPQPYLAMGAAICAVGALAGRRYRGPTDLRTNFYIAAVAESGGGKDHAPEVIRRALYEAGLDRYLGGENIASGRAVLSSLEQHPARLFQIDELGLFLKNVTGKNAPGHKVEIWSELMKLYSRAKGAYGGTEYANQKENARVNLQQPHAALYGMTTPMTFWSALEGGALMDGSLARFLVFVTDDNRPARNPSPGVVKPSAALIEALIEVSAGVHGHDHGGNLGAAMLSTVAMEPYTVQMTAAAKAAHERHLGDDEDAWAIKAAGTPQAAIVNRLGENSSKLALVRAISRHPQAPSIEVADIEWGWMVAMHCARTLLKDADRYIADSEFERKMNKAREIIRRHGPISSSDIAEKGFKVSRRERDETLLALIDDKSIIATEYPAGPKGGRPTIRYAINPAGIVHPNNPHDEGSPHE